ncbi:hypothetical protein K402DRAFT_331409 [Aulographum hederae CBS 113979]|uniref:C2H2-type domain-containing protein n=1 Tax=Aulographum hederae CBS 113979 TaxID=1176131 RepID=A0A6G1H1M7_9PEZI|nr:hypothetical protein K402DRAFT_331409 [Aulographum hederae CBS 113979]
MFDSFISFTASNSPNAYPEPDTPTLPATSSPVPWLTISPTPPTRTLAPSNPPAPPPTTQKQASQRDPIYSCDYCRRCDIWVVDIIWHELGSKNHHPCPRCRFDARFRKDLVHHWRISTCMIVCDGCLNGFLSMEKLREHYRKVPTCMQCKIHFESQKSLFRHRRIHLPHNRQCFACPLLFQSYADILRHLESGTCKSGIKHFHLDQCTATFPHWQNFMASHQHRLHIFDPSKHPVPVTIVNGVERLRPSFVCAACVCHSGRDGGGKYAFERLSQLVAHWEDPLEHRVAVVGDDGTPKMLVQWLRGSFSVRAIFNT